MQSWCISCIICFCLIINIWNNTLSSESYSTHPESTDNLQVNILRYCLPSKQAEVTYKFKNITKKLYPAVATSWSEEPSIKVN